MSLRWTTRFVSALVLASMVAPSVQAGGDPSAGAEKSKTCQACHGPDGNSVAPNFPILAGQHEDYLLRSLLDYKAGARKNAIMGAQVAALSEQDMKDLAAYYASQKGLLEIEVSYDFDVK